MPNRPIPFISPPLRRGGALVILAFCSAMVCSCAVYEGPGGGIGTAGEAMADGLVDAGVMAADVGLAAAAPVGFWGGGWSGGGTYQQNNYYNYHRRHDSYRHRSYGSFRGRGFRGGGRR